MSSSANKPDAAGPDFILVTRFNVQGDVNRPLPADEWLRSRMALFRATAYASIRAQTVSPDRWLLLFAAASPAWLKAEVEALVADVPSLEPIWVDGPIDMRRDVAALSAARATTGRVITARLDNDDAVSRDYVAAIKAAAPKSGRAFVNLTLGLQYRDGRVYWKRDTANPFVALVEPAADMAGVFVEWHNLIAAHAPVIQVSGPPRWLQVIHGGNLGNELRGIPAPPDALADFSIDLPVMPVAATRLLLSQGAAAVLLGLYLLSRPEKWSKLFLVLRSKLGR